jgi:hypothetical protein
VRAATIGESARLSIPYVLPSTAPRPVDCLRAIHAYFQHDAVRCAHPASARH